MSSVDNEQLPPHFFVCILTTLFLGIAYNTATNMGGIYIVSELGGSTDISVYSIVFFGLGAIFGVPLANPLADRLGGIKVLVYALLVYTFFSTLCAAAPTFFLLVFFRFGLGFASGFFYILVRRLIIQFAPAHHLPAHSMLMILFYATAPVVGSCLGGWLSYDSLWRLIFHLNEPIALTLALYFWLLHRHRDPVKESIKPFDGIGYLFLGLGLGLWMIIATLSQQLDWYRSHLLLFLFCIACPSAIFFFIWEWKHPHPIFELRLLKSPMLSYAMINLGVLYATYFGIITLLPLWLHLYVNYTPFWISLLFVIVTISGLVGYSVEMHFLRHLDARWALALAIIFLWASCYYSTYFDVEVDFFHLAVARFLSGLGLVLFLFPISALALASHKAKEAGNIFSLMQLVRLFFSSLGVGLYAILWQRRQVFFHERLGEALTSGSQLTQNFFYKAVNTFYLTPGQSKEQLNVFLNRQSTSLGLNDTFDWMSHLLFGLFVLLILSFVFEKIIRHRWPATGD